MRVRGLSALLPAVRSLVDCMPIGASRWAPAAAVASTGLAQGVSPPSNERSLRCPAPAYEERLLILSRRCENTGPSFSSWLSLRQHHHHAHQAAGRLVTLEEVEKACWSCDKLVKRGGLVCGGCKTIQPPDVALNYFDVFGLPRNAFDVDPQLLEKRYKMLQWNLHPDKMGQKSAEEQEFSAQQASTVNMAYSILKTPLSRANYILTCKGINAGDAFEGTIEDPELLMEVLEAREEVEGTHDPARLQVLLARNRRQQEELVEQMSGAFHDNDMGRAVGLVTQMQYLVRLEQEIIRKLPQL